MATNPKCAGCSFCCSILAIVELEKPAGENCQFCTGTSCTIHEAANYPPTCRDFECGYALGKMPPEFRPDRCKIMLTGEDAELYTHFLHVDPKHPYAPHTILGQQLIQSILQQSPYPNILVITGDKEHIISKNPVSKQILERKLARLREEAAREG